MPVISMHAGAVLACILADAAAFSVGFVPSLHGRPGASQKARPQGLSGAQPRRASRLGSAAAAPWRASAATPQFAPAGGLPSSYAWEKQWYPIFLEEFQNDEDPFPFTLLGQQVVFWKDKVAGEWRCMADRCPHRLVPLSEGRVLDNGEIECPYHGWTFQGNTGECTSIPHAPDENWSKPRACGTALDVSVKQGIVWVWPENLFNPPMFGEVRAKPDESLIPTMDVLDEHKDAVMDDVFRDVPYDWSTYVENVLDVSHVTFTHHGTQGKREGTKPFYFLELEPVTERGFELESVGPDRKPTGQGRNTKYVAPTYLHHTINFGAFLVYVATMAVPTKPGWCRIIGRFPVINAPEKLQKASKKIPTFMKHLKRLQVPPEPHRENFLPAPSRLEISSASPIRAAADIAHSCQETLVETLWMAQCRLIDFVQVLEDDNIFLHVGERTQRTVLGGAPFVDGTVQSDKWAKANYQATEADKPVINLRKWFDSNLPVKWTQVGMQDRCWREERGERREERGGRW